METGTIKKMKDTENKDGNRGKKKISELWNNFKLLTRYICN